MNGDAPLNTTAFQPLDQDNINTIDNSVSAKVATNWVTAIIHVAGTLIPALTSQISDPVPPKAAYSEEGTPLPETSASHIGTQPPNGPPSAPDPHGV